MANSEEVWKAFRQYDKDGSGSISMDELKEALEKFSTLKVTDEDIEQILRDADTNGDGEIGLVEFAEMTGFQKDVKKWKKLFNEVDSNKNGLLEEDEIKKVFVSNGFTESDVEIEVTKMYNKAGKKRGESFTLDEFVAAVVFHSPLKKSMKRSKIPLSQQKVEELKIIFSKYDVGNEGLGKKELTQILQHELSYEPSLKEIDFAMRKIDQDPTKKVGLTEFLEMMGLANDVQFYRETFQNFDKDKNGKIDIIELSEMMKELGIKTPKREARRALGKNSSLDFDQFVQFILEFDFS